METLTNALENDHLTDINSAFSMQELKECINSLQTDKSMGDDDIHNSFLKNLPDTKMNELLELINLTWEKSEIPSQWKKSLIIPILKDGKEPDLPDSYRPVALISCISKVAEKMISNRLMWQLEHEN